MAELGNLALALGMLVFGSFNTISNEFMDKTQAAGSTCSETITCEPSNFWSYADLGFNATKWQGKTRLDFDHPFVQAEFMFFGEAMCMLAFLFTNFQAKRRNPSEAWTMVHGPKSLFCYMITATCDMTATSLMYAGLVLSSPSLFQMLRGAIIIFTALLSVFWLKKKLYGFHWTGVALVVIGVIVVGAKSLLGGGGASGSGVLLGVLLILLAQAVQAVQVVTQEKFIRKYDTPDLLLVGLEGIFGAIMLGILLLPMGYVQIEGYPIESVGDAFVQISNSPSDLPTGHENWRLPVGSALLVSIVGNIFSIAFFNVFGIKITTVMSGAHRMVLDSIRTCVIWIFSLLMAWEKWTPASFLQLAGFAVMLFGIALYNEIIKFPSVFTYPENDVRTVGDAETRANLVSLQNKDNIAAMGDGAVNQSPNLYVQQDDGKSRPAPA